MRIGECPDRVKRAHVQFARVTVCVLVRIPHQMNYYAQRLDVLKVSLASLRAHTQRAAYNLLVFDNSSCPPVVEYLRSLQQDGAIDQLLLSAVDVGKIHACRIMFGAAPGELVAYADDDVWYGPRWLEECLQVFDTFPRVGMVSARPVRQQFAYGNAHLPEYLSSHSGIAVERGALIPIEWEREYLRSTGKQPGDADQLAAAAADIRLTCRGIAAYATATHFQFLAPKSIITAALEQRGPRSGSEERQFEEAVEAMRYVRLSTAGRHVRHLGNVIGEQEAAELGVTAAEVVWRPPAPWLRRAAHARLARAALARINRWSYALLNR